MHLGSLDPAVKLLGVTQPGHDVIGQTTPISYAEMGKSL